MAGAGVIGAVGAFLPWLTLSGAGSEFVEQTLEAQGEGLSGIDKDGSLTLVLCLLAAGFGLARSQNKIPKPAAIVGIVAGALVTLIAIIDIGDVSSRGDDFPMIELTIGVGIGLWLTLLAGLAVLATSVLALLRKT